MNEQSSDKLRSKALYYIIHHLGDAVYPGQPTEENDGWVLPLRVKERDGTFGRLFLSRSGEVVEARSTSRKALLEALAADDARQARPTTEPPDRPSKRVPGLNRGTIGTSDDFDAPLPDEFWDGSTPE